MQLCLIGKIVQGTLFKTGIQNCIRRGGRRNILSLPEYFHGKIRKFQLTAVGVEREFPGFPREVIHFRDRLVVQPDGERIPFYGNQKITPLRIFPDRQRCFELLPEPGMDFPFRNPQDQNVSPADHQR